jgi:hypothetical protein
MLPLSHNLYNTLYNLLFCQVNLESPTAHSVDMMIPYCVPSFDDAIALLCKFHGAWECQTEMNDEV